MRRDKILLSHLFWHSKQYIFSSIIQLPIARGNWNWSNVDIKFIIKLNVIILNSSNAENERMAYCKVILSWKKWYLSLMLRSDFYCCISRIVFAWARPQRLHCWSPCRRKIASKILDKLKACAGTFWMKVQNSGSLWLKFWSFSKLYFLKYASFDGISLFYIRKGFTEPVWFFDETQDSQAFKRFWTEIFLCSSVSVRLIHGRVPDFWSRLCGILTFLKTMQYLYQDSSKCLTDIWG